MSSWSSSLPIMTQIKELEMQIAQIRVINFQGFDIENPPWQKGENVGGNFPCIQVS